MAESWLALAPGACSEWTWDTSNALCSLGPCSPLPRSGPRASGTSGGVARAETTVCVGGCGWAVRRAWAVIPFGGWSATAHPSSAETSRDPTTRQEDNEYGVVAACLSSVPVRRWRCLAWGRVSSGHHLEYRPTVNEQAASTSHCGISSLSSGSLTIESRGLEGAATDLTLVSQPSAA